MASSPSPLSQAAGLLRHGETHKAAALLAGLLAGPELPRGYPMRQLVSAAHGFLVLLPDPHADQALSCIERALKLTATVQPGQATLF